MVSPVVGWTIGVAICCRSRPACVDVDFNFDGVQTSGELAQTHSVRKLIASCDTKLLWLRKPPSIGTNRIRGRTVDVRCRRFFVAVGRSAASCCSRVDLRGATVGVGGMVGSTTGIYRRGNVGVIMGTLPGTLFRVRRVCVRFVFFNVRLAVGLGAVIIGGAVVILGKVISVGTLCTTGGSPCVTLCLTGVIGRSTLCCGGGTYGSNWTSVRGSIHSCDGAVKVRTSVGGGASNRWYTFLKNFARRSGASLFKVDASSSITS